jgi:hypothetical protein
MLKPRAERSDALGLRRQKIKALKVRKKSVPTLVSLFQSFVTSSYLAQGGAALCPGL